jgi:hypothetical protein
MKKRRSRAWKPKRKYSGVAWRAKEPKDRAGTNYVADPNNPDAWLSPSRQGKADLKLSGRQLKKLRKETRRKAVAEGAVEEAEYQTEKPPTTEGLISDT